MFVSDKTRARKIKGTLNSRTHDIDAYLYIILYGYVVVSARNQNREPCKTPRGRLLHRRANRRRERSKSDESDHRRSFCRASLPAPEIAWRCRTDSERPATATPFPPGAKRLLNAPARRWRPCTRPPRPCRVLARRGRARSLFGTGLRCAASRARQTSAAPRRAPISPAVPPHTAHIQSTAIIPIHARRPRSIWCDYRSPTHNIDNNNKRAIYTHYRLRRRRFTNRRTNSTHTPHRTS